jgi:hypothetical protein
MCRFPWGALGVGIAFSFVGSPADAPAQAVPECAPGSAFGVTLKAREYDREAPAVATHEILVEAEFTGDARRVSLTPPPGVPTIGRANGNPIALIAPNASAVTITVSWRQQSDPEDPATSCSVSREVTVSLLAAAPSHAAKPRLWRIGQTIGIYDVAIVPALRRPDLSPLKVSARTTSRVQFPPASAKPRTMSVPMRTADQIRYRTRLPGLATATVAQVCRFYSLACATPFAPGGAFVEVSRMFLDDRALRRGIERPDINNGLAMLARTQPFKTAARYGIMVEARPGGVRLGRPRPFGYDVQIRQSGRLIARVRSAGRCVERRLPQGLVNQCRIARRSAELH